MQDNRCVYAICPANVATGGTEAIHALVHELRKLGVSAKIYYTDVKPGKGPVPQRFQRFDTPYVTILDDCESCSLVVPETMTDLLRRFPLMKKYIWWLSVDNYVRPLRFCGPRTMIQLILGRLLKRNVDFKDQKIHHCCQSYYAMDFVKRHGVANAYFLMDYLGAEHLLRPSGDRRENVVLYNPAKGIWFTWKLMRAVKGRARFVALKGMSPAEVHNWCSRAKVYVDFGNHPGKDRFPREAAMAGCIVITSKRGAAAFHEDVPIPDAYKFNDSNQDMPRIVSLLMDCMDRYDIRKSDFDEYREFVRKDYQRFVDQVKAIFLK